MNPRHDTLSGLPLPLDRLLAACRDGDELAWEALVRATQGRILALARSYVRDPDEARDLVQEIYVKLYRRLPLCRDADRFLPWLLKLARRHCLDHLRRRGARPPARDIPVEEAVGLADPGPDPGQAHADEERRRLLWRALAVVGEAEREVLVLQEMQGLSVARVGELLGIPAGTVKSRAHRGRLQLARALRRLLAGSAGRGRT